MFVDFTVKTNFYSKKAVSLQLKSISEKEYQRRHLDSEKYLKGQHRGHISNQLLVILKQFLFILNKIGQLANLLTKLSLLLL